MRPKPIVIVAQNTKGGVGISAIQALIYYTLQTRGINPLVVALDTNSGLLNQIMLPDPEKPGSFLGNPEVYVWDINSTEENREVLPAVIQKAMDEARPVIVDLPAKGGQTQGIYNVLRSGALRFATVVGVAPIRKGDLPHAGAIEAYEDIKPARWIKVTFGPAPRSNSEPTQLEMALASLKPDHSIRLELLHEDEAKELGQRLPVPLPEIGDYALAGGPALSGLFVVAEYWVDSFPKVEAALRAVAPELFSETVSDTPVPTSGKTKKSA